MALQGISEAQQLRLLERIRLRHQTDPELALSQQEKLAGLYSKYHRLLRELENTIGAYRKTAAAVNARNFTPGQKGKHTLK